MIEKQVVIMGSSYNGKTWMQKKQIEYLRKQGKKSPCHWRRSWG